MKEADRWFETIAAIPIPNDPGSAVPPGIPLDAEKSTGVLFSTLASTNVLTQEDVDFVMKKDFSEIIVARFDYFDIWGKHYWTNGCWSITPNGTIILCHKHNEIN
jgi:hypothetical protein